MTDITFGAYDLQVDGEGPMFFRIVAPHKKHVPVTFTTRRSPRGAKKVTTVTIYINREEAWLLYHRLGLKLRSEKP